MSDATRRALRSLLQIGTVNAVIALLAVFEVIHWTPVQVGAVNAVALPLVSFAQNWLEDKGAIPALIKSPASSGAKPVPEDAGTP